MLTKLQHSLAHIHDWEPALLLSIANLHPSLKSTQDLSQVLTTHPDTIEWVCHGPTLASSNPCTHGCTHTWKATLIDRLTQGCVVCGNPSTRGWCVHRSLQAHLLAKEVVDRD